MVDQPEINGRRAVRPALITALTLALALVSVGAFAETGTSGGNVDDKAQQLQAQLQSTRDLLQAKGMDPTVRELGVRIESVEKAVALAHDDLVRVPTKVQEAIGGLKEFIEERVSGNDRVSAEKFSGIAVQFRERDERAAQLAIQQKDAADKLAKAGADNIAAALISQKETADKTEKNVLESLSQDRTLLRSEIATLIVQINDLKSRLDRSEGQNNGTSPVVASLNATLSDLRSRLDSGEGKSKGAGDVWGYIIGGGGLLIAAMAFMFSMFNRPTSRPHTLV